MNLINLLPDEIKRHIFEYDITYKEKFDKVIHSIPELVEQYSLSKTKKDKYGWSNVNAIFKLRNKSIPNKNYTHEHINIHDCSHSIINLLKIKMNDFYGYSYKCNYQSDWYYHKYNGRSIYSKYYEYPGISINVNIFLTFEYQKYSPKSYISDKHIKKRIKCGRYMDMGHYQRCEI